MNEDQHQLASTAARLFADHAADESTSTWSPSLWSQADDMGLNLIGVPPAAGGAGGGMADLGVILIEAGRAAVRIPLGEHALSAWSLAQVGVTIPSNRLSIQLPRLGPSAEDLPNEPSVYAMPVGWGRHALQILVVDPQPSDSGLRLYAESQVKFELVENLAGEPRDRLINAEQPLVLAQLTPELATGIVYRDALMRSFLIVGATSRVLSLSIAHAKERQQFGRPINRFQAVQHQLAQLASAVRLARASAFAAALAIDGGDELAPAVAAARVQASDTASVAITVGHQVHAAMGITLEHQLHRYTRRLMAWRDEGGGALPWARHLGRWATTSGSDSVWGALTAAPEAGAAS